MAETFSIGAALATAVRVIRRHPVAVFVWGLVVMAFSLGGVALMFGALAQMPLGEAGTEPPPEFFAQFLAVQGASMLLNLGQLILSVVVWSAAMRAAFQIGRRDRVFFLRFGMDEVRLAVVGLALFVGAYFAVIVLVLIGAALVIGVWQASEIAAVLLGFALTLALIVAVAVAMARLSLIAPATLALRRLAFVEGWALGRGRTGKLLGLLVSTWLLYMLIYAVTAFALVVIAFSTGLFEQWSTLQEPQTFADILPSPVVFWSFLAFALLPGSFLYGAVMTLLCAPFASACRQLMDGEPMGREPAVALVS